MRIIAIALILLSLSVDGYSKPDWNEAKHVHLIRGRESPPEVMVVDLHISGDLRLLQLETIEGMFRHLETSSATLYDFTDEKGVVSWQEGRAIVLDTSSIMYSETSEIIYLLDRSVEEFKEALISVCPDVSEN